MKLAALLKLADAWINTTYEGRTLLKKIVERPGEVEHLADEPLVALERTARALLAASEDFELSEELGEIVAKVDAARLAL